MFRAGRGRPGFMEGVPAACRARPAPGVRKKARAACGDALRRAQTAQTEGGPMLHEVSFPSFNGRDQVQGWIYVPACEPVGVV